MRNDCIGGKLQKYSHAGKDKQYQSEVGIGRRELDVDEFVDVCFGLQMEVLFHHRLHF